MKRIIEDDEQSGLEAHLGDRITLFCCRFIYTGKLIGVDDTSVLLSDCGIVYETGAFDTAEWQDYQKLPNNWSVAIQSIESFGILK